MGWTWLSMGVVRPWRLAWTIVVGLLVVGVLGAGASTALGRTGRSLPGSQFQGNDGNQANDNGLDWEGLPAIGVPVGYTPDPIDNQDDYFSGGRNRAGNNKENFPIGWNIVIGDVGKDGNIADTYRAVQRGAPPCATCVGDAFVYLGLTRTQTTNGTVSFAFELNQNPVLWNNGSAPPQIPCRTNGDLAIIITKTGNDTPQFLVAEWHTTQDAPPPPPAGSNPDCAAEGAWTQLNLGSNVIEGATNSGDITSYLPSVIAPDHGNIPPQQFFEVAVNLTKVIESLHPGHPPGCPDIQFNSIWARSKAASFFDDNSTLKDYVAPSTFVVRPCGKLSPDLSSNAAVTYSYPARSTFDVANLTGGAQPTGKITFNLYGPNDRRCSRSPIHTYTNDQVNGNGPYASDAFTLTRPGTYRWTVTYSGDANNHGAGRTDCGIASETVRIPRSRPTITTAASATTVLPGAIHDTATLTGGFRPRGTIKFEVFAPGDTTCATPVETFTVRVRGNGDYQSPDFTPTATGTWLWVASYSGDRHNHSDATACGDRGEEVAVVPPLPPLGAPTLTTTASDNVQAGSPISDTAHLTGGTNPTGTITFTVYGPDDANCSNAPAAPPVTVKVSGEGQYHSGDFTPTAAGTYRWIATYSGDDSNHGASTSCDDKAEAVVVSKAKPTLTTEVPDDSVPNGDGAGDIAHLTGGADPQGTITFHLYGPDDPHCSGPAAFVVTQNVHGNGSVSSPRPEPSVPGTYRWVAMYSGDANNASASTECGDPHESLVVLEEGPNIPKPPEEIPETSEPGHPSEPSEPGHPSEPGQPSKPHHPSKPGHSSKPSHPSKPGVTKPGTKHRPKPKPPPPRVTG